MSRFASIVAGAIALLMPLGCGDSRPSYAIENFDYLGKSISVLEMIDGEWHMGGHILLGKQRTAYLAVLGGLRVEREIELGQGSVDHVASRNDSLFAAVNTQHGESRIYHVAEGAVGLVAALDGYILDLKAPEGGQLVAATSSDGDFSVAVYGDATRTLVHLESRPVDFTVGESGESCVASSDGPSSEIRCFAPDGSLADTHSVEGDVRYIALTGDGSVAYVFERDGHTFLGSTNLARAQPRLLDGRALSRPFRVSGCRVAVVYNEGGSLTSYRIARSQDCGGSWSDTRGGSFLTASRASLVGDTLYHYEPIGRLAIP